MDVQDSYGGYMFCQEKAEKGERSLSRVSGSDLETSRLYLDQFVFWLQIRNFEKERNRTMAKESRASTPCCSEFNRGIHCASRGFLRRNEIEGKRCSLSTELCKTDHLEGVHLQSGFSARCYVSCFGVLLFRFE